MKRISLFAILTSCVISIYAYDFHVGDFYYRLSADGSNEVEIVPLENDSVYAQLRVVNIPESVSFNDVNYLVTSIGDTAFSYCNNITEIILPSTITRIGKLAFNHCIGLKQITVPASVKFIGENVFSECIGLEAVTWNAIECSAPQRGDGGVYPAFMGATNLSSFVFGDSVKVIPVGLCYGLTNITEIKFPATITSIGDYAFYHCDRLSTITIPKSIEHMGKNVFGACNGLTKVIWEAKDCTIPCSGEDDSPILSPIFLNDSNIRSFIFGDSVQSIPMGLCYALSNIECIQLPLPLRYIGYKAFYGVGIKSLTLPPNIEIIGNDAFDDCDSLHLVEWNTDKLIPSEYESLWSLENRIFGYKSHVRSIVFGENVQTIPRQSCSALPNLQSVLFKGDVLHIEESAFEYCPLLCDVVLPHSLLSLGTYAFSSTGLKEITVPAQCTHIGEGVFADCKKMRRCYFEGIHKISGLDVSWFDECRDLQIIISDGTIIPWW